MVQRSLMAVAAAILSAAVAVPSPARAEPDRHIPDPSAGYCPGGVGIGYRSPAGHGYCDGMHYPDGSYWRIVQSDSPGRPTMQCVVNPGGGPVPEPAPPGGCNGAV